MAPTGRVLIIDDDEAIRNLVVELLTNEGYEPVAAGDGATALALVRPPHFWQPDLILLDVRMPEMGGPAFAEAYDATPGPHAPIVLLTGTSGVDAAARTEQIEAAGFVGKPFDLDHLLAVVRHHTTPGTTRNAQATGGGEN